MSRLASVPCGCGCGTTLRRGAGSLAICKTIESRVRAMYRAQIDHSMDSVQAFNAFWGNDAVLMAAVNAAISGA